MSKNYARRDGRDTAYAGATQEDADRLNPYKAMGRRTAWDTEWKAEQWNEGFMEVSRTLTEQADRTEEEKEFFALFMARDEEDRWRAVFDFMCERGYEL